MNLADLGSRGATIVKMERGNWFAGPDWLLDKRRWPEQPRLNSTKETDEESKVTQEAVLRTQERVFDEWDALLERSTYWRTMRVTAWVLRFIRNCKARSKSKKMSGPLVTEEITAASDYWVKRVQKAEETCLKSPGWKLVKDDCTGVLRCEGRIKGYRPIYLPGGLLAEKLILHIHNQVMHLGVANTMASVRENWWIPKLRAKVKKVIKNCNICKVYSTKPYRSNRSGLCRTLPVQYNTNLLSTPRGGFSETNINTTGNQKDKQTNKQTNKKRKILKNCQ